MDQSGLVYLLILGCIVAIGGLILLYLYWAKKNRTKQKPQAKPKSNEYSNEEIIEEVVEVQPVEIKQEAVVKEDPKPQPQPVAVPVAETPQPIILQGVEFINPISELIEAVNNNTKAQKELLSALVIRETEPNGNHNDKKQVRKVNAKS